MILFCRGCFFWMGLTVVFGVWAGIPLFWSVSPVRYLSESGVG